MAFSSDFFVMMALRDALPEEIHDELPRLVGHARLLALLRGDPVRAHGRDAHDLEGRGHGVRGELTSTGARAGTRLVLDRAESGSADLPRVAGPDGLEDVLDRQAAPLVLAEMNGTS